jgi:hypothetical protein
MTGIGSPTAISAKGGVPMYNIANTLPEQIRSKSVALLDRHRAASFMICSLQEATAQAPTATRRPIVFWREKGKN